MLKYQIMFNKLVIYLYTYIIIPYFHDLHLGLLKYIIWDEDKNECFLALSPTFNSSGCSSSPLGWIKGVSKENVIDTIHIFFHFLHGDYAN